MSVRISMWSSVRMPSWIPSLSLLVFPAAFLHGLRGWVPLEVVADLPSVPVCFPHSLVDELVRVASVGPDACHEDSAVMAGDVPVREFPVGQADRGDVQPERTVA